MTSSNLSSTGNHLTAGTSQRPKPPAVGSSRAEGKAGCFQGMVLWYFSTSPKTESEPQLTEHPWDLPSNRAVPMWPEASVSQSLLRYCLDLGYSHLLKLIYSEDPGEFKPKSRCWDGPWRGTPCPGPLGILSGLLLDSPGSLQAPWLQAVYLRCKLDWQCGINIHSADLNLARITWIKCQGCINTHQIKEYSCI